MMFPEQLASRMDNDELIDAVEKLAAETGDTRTFALVRELTARYRAAIKVERDRWASARKDFGDLAGPTTQPIRERIAKAIEAERDRLDEEDRGKRPKARQATICALIAGLNIAARIARTDEA